MTALFASSPAVRVSAEPSPVMLVILAILTESASAPAAPAPNRLDILAAVSATAMLLTLLAARTVPTCALSTAVTISCALDRLVILVSRPLAGVAM